MTWPFENNTKMAVKHLSVKSFCASKWRNILTILTITLATALLTSILFWGFGTTRANRNAIRGTAQIVYHGITEEQGQELYRQEDIVWIGEIIYGPTEQVNDSVLTFHYGNAEILESQNISFQGEMPVKENEIMLQKSFLKNLGKSDALGQTVTLRFSDGRKSDFVLTGIWETAAERKDHFMAVVSKEYLKRLIPAASADYYICLKNAKSMTEEGTAEYAAGLAEELGISKEQTIVLSNYFTTMENGSFSGDMLFYLLVGLITLIGAGIVIYSIFYIAMANQIRSYGQLRTIGATKHQIRKMVYREGKILAAIGIPIGLLIGNGMGYFLAPNSWQLFTAFMITAAAGGFTLFIVVISIRMPVKKASEVSPMEAVRFSAYQGNYKTSTKLHRKITPVSLAIRNLSRNKRKTALTVLSLSIGGSILVLISSLMISYDGVAETRHTYPVGEYHINLNANQSWDTADVSLAGIQRKNVLNEKFQKQVEAIDGVTGTKRWYHTEARYYVNGYEGKAIQGFTREEVLELENHILEGTVSYDELVSQNGIVLIRHGAEIHSFFVGLGDSVEVNFETVSGETVTRHYTVMGIISNYDYSGYTKVFTMPEQLMNEACGMDCTATLAVITEPDKTASVGENLRRLISGNSDFVLKTFEDALNTNRYNQQTVLGTMLIIAIMLVCFSLINLVNTTITNFLSRKQEFGILQAVGLTKGLSVKLLRYESMFYSLGAAFIAAVAGGGLGFLTVQGMKSVNPYFTYTFPWVIAFGYLGILLIVQFILSAFTIGSLKKQSLVEQIKTME